MSTPRIPPADPSAKANAGRVRTALGAASELEEALAARRPVDVWLSAWYRAHPECGSRDRRFLSETLFSYLRWRGWIGTVSERGALALFAAHQLQSSGPSPLTEALAEAAGVAADRLPPIAPFSLDEKARALAKLFDQEPLPIDRLVPDWVPHKLALPPDEDSGSYFSRCVESFQIRPPLWLSAIGISAMELVHRLSVQSVPARIDARLAGAVCLEGWPHLPELERAIGPCFEVQDLASQAVVAACAPNPGETWWDPCAGSGGKSLGLAERMSRKGHVWATDIRSSALVELQRRVRRIGFTEIRWRQQCGLNPPPGRVDGVLVDAPCSGMGTWSRSPDARWRMEAEEVKALAQLQRQLLDSAARAVHPGGRLVYSVCTLTHEETTNTAEEFLNAHPDFLPDPFQHPLGIRSSAAAQWILPWNGPSGAMFVARWRRNGVIGTDR